MSPIRRVKGVENLLEEIIAENFPKSEKETDIQVQEAERALIKLNPGRPTPGHIMIVKYQRSENMRKS